MAVEVDAMSNAAQRNPGEASPIVQLAILVGIFVLVLNAGFYFLSDAYFDDRVKKFGIQEPRSSPRCTRAPWPTAAPRSPAWRR
jgi:capsular polysaccharide biosynthesis protein